MTALTYPWEMPGSWRLLLFCKVPAILPSWLICCQTQQRRGFAKAPLPHSTLGGILGPVHLSSRTGAPAITLAYPPRLLHCLLSLVIHLSSVTSHTRLADLLCPISRPFFLLTSAFCKPSPTLVSKWLYCFIPGSFPLLDLAAWPFHKDHLSELPAS